MRGRDDMRVGTGKGREVEADILDSFMGRYERW